PEWARRENIRALCGQPLIHSGLVIGVLAVFFRTRLVAGILMWLRLIADRIAAVIADEHDVQLTEVGGHSAAAYPAAFQFPPPVYPELPGYEILGEAGRGGMGVIYKARQAGSPRLVAIKVVPFGVGERDVLARFHQERVLSARLAHPNLVEAYDAGGIAGL